MTLSSQVMNWSKLIEMVIKLLDLYWLEAVHFIYLAGVCKQVARFLALGANVVAVEIVRVVILELVEAALIIFVEGRGHVPVA